MIQKDFGGLFDSVKNFAAQVIPSHTIVGKALKGDYTGAAAGALKAGASAIPSKTSGTATPIQPIVEEPASSSFLSTPVLLGAAGGLVLLLLVLRSRRKA